MDTLTRVHGARGTAVHTGWRLSGSLPVSYQAVGVAVFLLDFSGIAATGVLSGVLYHLAAFSIIGDVGSFLGAGFVVASLFVTSEKASGAYKPVALVNRRFGLAHTVLAWTAVFAVFTTAAFLLKIGDSVSRGTMLVFYVAGLVVVSSMRLVASRTLSRALNAGTLKGRQVVALSDPDEFAGEEVGTLLRQNGYDVRHHFVLPDGQPSFSDSMDAVHDLMRKLVAYVRGQKVEEVLVFVNWSDKKRVDALLGMLHVVPLPVRLVPDRTIRGLLSYSSATAGSDFAIEVQRAPLTFSERAVKRILDISLASVGLLLLLPTLAIVAVAVKLDSAGPIFFRQTRAGFNGRCFRIYKFRTMTTMDDGPVVRQATRDDTRVTRVGRWLRRTSIDELPQLINVVAGHMSLVGPRPHALAHDDQYDPLIARYAQRHHVKPGITGWAQVNGLRGETPNVEAMQRRVEYDLWYISNWSIWLEIRIILRTVVQLTKGDEAY